MEHIEVNTILDNNDEVVMEAINKMTGDRTLSTITKFIVNEHKMKEEMAESVVDRVLGEAVTLGTVKKHDDLFYLKNEEIPGTMDPSGTKEIFNKNGKFVISTINEMTGDRTLSTITKYIVNILECEEKLVEEIVEGVLIDAVTFGVIKKHGDHFYLKNEEIPDEK